MTTATSAHPSRVPVENSATAAGQSAEILARWSLLLLILYAFVRNIVTAASRPLWYDELCTLAVSRQPSLTALWRAVSETKDANPPIYYILERLFLKLPVAEQIALRLPSILAFCIAVACLFLVTRRRASGFGALLCASILLLTPLLRPYAVEARPYSLVAACLAFALVCYQRAPRLPWMILLGAAFLAAESLHYYAIFGFFPFGVAELFLLIAARRFRIAVWLALAAGFVPLIVFWHLLAAIRAFYGAHIWDPPSLFATANAYSLLLRAFPPVAIAVVIVLAAIVLRPVDEPSSQTVQERLAARSQRWLAVAFLALPIVVFIVTKILHGAFIDRYVLPMLLGVPLSVAYMFRVLPRKGVALVAVFVFAALGLQEAFFWQTAIHGLFRLDSPAVPIEQLVTRAGHPELPVVVSDGQDYLQLAHYSREPQRFVTLVDPPQAIVYARSDSLDLQVGLLQCCMPVHVYPFQEFAAQHRSFLLYSGATDWDWWPARLVGDGDSLQLVATERQRKIYLVNLK